MSEPTRRSEDEDSELHFTRLSGEPVAEPPAVMRLDDPAVDAELPKPKRRWRGRLIALGLLVGLGALVWYAPLLAVAGPWRSAAIGAVLPPLNGTLTVEQAQLGWNAPIRLQGIEIRDPQGEPALSIESLTVQNTLLELLLKRGALGVVKAVGPRVELTAQDGSHNFAKVFDAWTKPPKDAPPGTPAPPLPRELRVQIESGEWIVTLPDETGRPVAYHIDDWNADVGLDLERDGPWTARGKLREGSYEFIASGDYEAAPGVFTIAQLSAHSTTAPWAIETRGRFSVRPGQKTDLQGSLRYDLPTLAAALRPLLGPSFELEGGGFAPFTVVTSPAEMAAPASPGEFAWLKPLTGGVEVAWSRASWSGIDVGPAIAATRLDQAVVSLSVPETDVSGGRFQTHASLDLLAAQPAVTVQPGVVLQDFELTPKICDGGLRFVLPALADAAQISGRTSLDLAACRIPLHDPGVGDLSGKLSIHAIEVGPRENSLLHQVASVLRVPGAVKVIDGAVVEFALKNRRVESKGFRFKVGDVEVQVYGSVGLDESLALLAETTIPPQWLGNGPLATLLKSQSLRVPIGGTLKQPKVQVERLGEVNSGLTHDMAGVLERGLSVGDEWAKGMGDRVRSGSGLLDVMRGLVEPNGDANNSPTGTPSPSGAADPNGAPAQPDLGERLLEGLGDRLRKRFGRDEPAPADDPPR